MFLIPFHKNSLAIHWNCVNHSMLVTTTTQVEWLIYEIGKRQASAADRQTCSRRKDQRICHVHIIYMTTYTEGEEDWFT